MKDYRHSDVVLRILVVIAVVLVAFTTYSVAYGVVFAIPDPLYQYEVFTIVDTDNLEAGIIIYDSNGDFVPDTDGKSPGDPYTTLLISGQQAWIPPGTYTIVTYDFDTACDSSCTLEDWYVDPDFFASGSMEIVDTPPPGGGITIEATDVSSISSTLGVVSGVLIFLLTFFSFIFYYRRQ